jgi:hypothetical protein
MMTQGAMVFPVVTRDMIDPWPPPVRDPKAVDSIDFQDAVDHRHGALAHLGGAALVPVARGGIAHEALKFGTLQVARHDFAFGKGTKLLSCQSGGTVARRPSRL